MNVFDFDATTTQGGILLALWYLVLFAAVIGAIYAFCIFVGPSLDRITNRDNARRAAVPRGWLPKWYPASGAEKAAMAAVFVVTFLLAGVVGPAALALLVAYLAFLYVRDYRRGRADVRRLELKLRERVDSEGITPKLIEDLDNTEIIYGRRTVRKLSARLGIPNN